MRPTLETPPAAPPQESGVEGNSRLTSVTGVVLLVLLAVEGLTVAAIGPLISVHIYLGVLLVGPVLLKAASTTYRFARFYLGAEPYVRKGPPHPVLRVLGPLLIASTLAVLGTGIGLIFTGPGHREPLLSLHKASFILWFAVMTIHVLGHAIEAGRATAREIRDRHAPRAGRRWRSAAALLSLGGGVALASALYPVAHAWTTGTLTH